MVNWPKGLYIAIEWQTYCLIQVGNNGQCSFLGFLVRKLPFIVPYVLRIKNIKTHTSRLYSYDYWNVHFGTNQLFHILVSAPPHPPTQIP